MDWLNEQADGKKPKVAPILVLGLGNVLLGDDGIGPRLIRELQGLYTAVEAVECVDGGTQGLALLGYFALRQSLIIIDAFTSGRSPGEISTLDRSALLEYRASHASTAHEGNAVELLATAQLLDELPPRVFLIGIEPECVQTDLALSERVTKGLPAAFARVCAIVEQELARVADLAAA